MDPYMQRQNSIICQCQRCFFFLSPHWTPSSKHHHVWHAALSDVFPINASFFFSSKLEQLDRSCENKGLCWLLNTLNTFNPGAFALFSPSLGRSCFRGHVPPLVVSSLPSNHFCCETILANHTSSTFVLLYEKQHLQTKSTVWFHNCPSPQTWMSAFGVRLFHPPDRDWPYLSIQHWATHSKVSGRWIKGTCTLMTWMSL